jgi:hypothetical protein
MPWRRFVHLELGDARAVELASNGVDLQLWSRVRDTLRANGRRHVVVVTARLAESRQILAAGELEPLDPCGHVTSWSKWRSMLEHGRAVLLFPDDMLVPDIVVKRAAHSASSLRSLCGARAVSARPTRVSAAL